jgi:hypothetical protein
MDFNTLQQLRTSKKMIITRNLRDFKNSKMPAMTAKQFIGMID